jgi:RNA polymerase sigma-70 factor (ECF subfamily)
MSSFGGGPDKDSLLPRARAGDLDAFCGLAREHEKRLYGQALGLCRDRHLAEDLTQETLLEAWKSLSRYNSTCRFSTWLYAILLHRYQKSLRKRGRFLRFGEGAIFGGGAEHKAAVADPAEAASVREEAERLRAAIAALPSAAREVIQLRFFADATLSEISIALKIPVGTAKSRLHYALMRLRQTHEPELNHFPLSRDS